jgi:hypothetical protein
MGKQQHPAGGAPGPVATPGPRARRRGAAPARARAGALHLVDLDEAYGGPDQPDDPAACLERLAGLWEACDHVVVTGDAWVLSSAVLAPEGARRSPRPVARPTGVDGRTAGLERVDATFVARRFSKLVITSADARFAPLAAAVRAQGGTVWVASVVPPAPALAEAADRVVALGQEAA